MKFIGKQIDYFLSDFAFSYLDAINRWFAKSFLEGLLFPELQSAFAKENWKEIIHQNLIQNKMNAKVPNLDNRFFVFILILLILLLFFIRWRCFLRN
jgi:hypothetical protein